MKGLCRTFALLAVGLLLAVPGWAAELTVSAAASLTNVFRELKPIFDKASPGNTLVFNFAASGPLLRQIESGAPVDVFASADQETMDQAAAKGLIDPKTRRNFAANTLVLIVPSHSTLGVQSARDLEKPAVTRIALGNPDSVPAGRYARQALNAQSLYDALKPKFILGESVRQVLDYVSREEVQAGFVYATDAAIAKGTVAVAVEMSGHTPITYPVAVVAASKNKELADVFRNFLASPEAQAVLAKYGFKKP